MNGRLSLKIKQAIPSIEKVSITILVKAYQSALTDKSYDLMWEEEQFSSYLVGIMERSNLSNKYQLIITTEDKLIDYDKLPINKNNPKKIPRIDISISSWAFSKIKVVKYFFEAKNLYEINIQNKATASHYINRYIDTGIENFRVKKYYDGSLIGYVLQGNVDNIIDKLNIQLQKDRKNYKAINSLSSIEKIDCVSSFSYCYSSKYNTDLNDELDIKHIFLKF